MTRPSLSSIVETSWCLGRPGYRSIPRSRIEDAEAKLGVTFPPDYRNFLLEVSDISYNVLEPATIFTPGAHGDQFWIGKRARERWRVPGELVPICEGNADYDCLTPEGRVICWSHDMQAPIGEERPDLAAWIEQVWIHDYAAAEPDAAVGDGGMSLGRWRAGR